MGQNKLETQFKKKLNSREIKPSDMAWDRLNAMLSIAEPSNSGQVQKTKRKFIWLYIAASFIGFLLIPTVFFNQKENIIDIKKNTLVIEKTSPKESTKTEIASKKTEPNFSKKILNSETKPLVQTHQNTTTKIENATFKNKENVVAEIQAITPNEPIVEHKNTIPENIDNLLASAEKNQESGVKNPSVKINPTDLLNQVDGELQVSFREKALNTISQKFKEAREALANRNNQ